MIWPIWLEQLFQIFSWILSKKKMDLQIFLWRYILRFTYLHINNIIKAGQKNNDLGKFCATFFSRVDLNIKFHIAPWKSRDLLIWSSKNSTRVGPKAVLCANKNGGHRISVLFLIPIDFNLISQRLKLLNPMENQWFSRIKKNYPWDLKLLIWSS